MSTRRTISSLLGLGAVIALDYVIFNKMKQKRRESRVDTASDDSFPASDAPGWTGTDIN